MNKMDITIMHIQNCADEAEAWRKIDDPIKGFGYNLTKNERCLCKHYARLYFSQKRQEGEE